MKEFFRSVAAGLRVFFGTKDEFGNELTKLMKRYDTIWMRLILSCVAILVTFWIFASFYQVGIKDFGLNFCTNMLVLFITLIFIDWYLEYQRKKKRSSIRLAMERDLADLRNLYFDVVVVLSGLALKYKVGPGFPSMMDKMGLKGSNLSRFVDTLDDLEKCWLPVIEELKGRGYPLDDKYLKLLKQQADKLKEAAEHKISLFGQFYEDYIFSFLLTTYRLSQTLAAAIQQYQTFEEFIQLDNKESKTSRSSQKQYQEVIKNRYKELAADIYSNLAINLIGLLVYWVYLEQLPQDNNVKKLMEYWRQYS